jgi:serine/threonine-protein kinase
MNDTARGPREDAHFGRYHLKRLLGRGGIGEVYEAEDTAENRIVALKVLPPVFSHDLVFCARLQREARTARRLREPHIVPIHDYGEIDGQQFLDMRLIEGDNLSQLLKRAGTLNAPLTVAIVRQIASALDAAHAARVLHGDVKPENILITRDDFAYLVDFGIADAAARDGVARVVGSAAGNWKYTAPERFTEAGVNHKLDIYSLTCVLYECLTGSPPYWADSAGALLSAHLTEPIPRPSQVRSGISDAFDEVIARGMAKDPLERYASAGDLALAAQDALSAPDQERADEIVKRSWEATVPDADVEPSSAPTPQPTADPDHETSVAESLDDPEVSAAGLPTGAPRAIPRFGLGDSAWPDEFAMPPPMSRPPWAASSTQRPRLLLGAAAVLAVIVLSGVVIWLVHPSHPAHAVRGTAGTTTTTKVPSPPGAENQARLFSMLPPGYPPGTCTPATPAKEALAEMSCAKNADPDGPPSATYTLLPNVATLRNAFNRIVQSSKIIDCPGRIQSPGPWHRNATPDKTSGALLCGIQQGRPTVAWTNDAERLIGIVRAEPPGSGIDQLYAWWTSHS